MAIIQLYVYGGQLYRARHTYTESSRDREKSGIRKYMLMFSCFRTISPAGTRIAQMRLIP